MSLNMRLWRQLECTMLVGLSAIVISVMAPKVAHAYGMQLALPQTPVSRMNFGFSGSSPEHKLRAVNASVPLNASFLSHVVQSAVSTPSRALWVMYPAAVRGRAFGGTGADPLVAGSGGGW